MACTAAVGSFSVCELLLQNWRLLGFVSLFLYVAFGGAGLVLKSTERL